MWNVVVYTLQQEIFEVLTTARMIMFFFWVVTPCRIVGRYS
jgi:hypothetical protein